MYLVTQGKTTKEKLTNKATKTNSKLLFCIVRDPPNFKGGDQWLTRVQYEMYKEYLREVDEGRVREFPEPQVIDLFQKQRELMSLNEDYNRELSVKKNDVEQGLIDSLTLRIKRLSEKQKEVAVTPVLETSKEEENRESELKNFRYSGHARIDEFKLRPPQESIRESGTNSFRVVIHGQNEFEMEESKSEVDKSFSLGPFADKSIRIKEADTGLQLHDSAHSNSEHIPSKA